MPPPKAPSPEIVEDMDAERAFEKLRKAAHVRPWDHGKDGLQKPCMFINLVLKDYFLFIVNIFVLLLCIVLTQEEWNEKQRDERKSEFSWNYVGTSVHKNTLDNQHSDKSNDEDDDIIGPSMDMFLTPNNPNKQSTITPKSFKQPIHNELDDEPVINNKSSNNDSDDDLDSIPLPPTELRKGTEIAPPPTYEYYGPNDRGRKSQKHFISVNEMKDSIAKGFESANSTNKTRQIKGIIDDGDD